MIDFVLSVFFLFPIIILCAIMIAIAAIFIENAVMILVDIVFDMRRAFKKDRERDCYQDKSNKRSSQFVK